MTIRDAFDRLVYRLSGGAAADRQRRQTLNNVRYFLSRSSLMEDEQEVVAAFYSGHVQPEPMMPVSQITAISITTGRGLTISRAVIACEQLRAKGFIVPVDGNHNKVMYRLDASALQSYLSNSQRLGNH